MLDTVGRVVQIAFLVVATGLGGYFLYGKLQSEPRRQLDPFRRTLAESAVEQLVAELPRRDEIRKLCVAPVLRDVDHRVYDILVEQLHGAELYFLADDDLVLDHVREKLRGREPTTLDEAIALAKELKSQDNAIEGVLFPTLRTFSDGHRGLGAEVTLDAVLATIDPPAAVPGGLRSAEAKIESRASVAFLTPFMESTSVLVRLLAFVAFAAGLPFALLPVARGVLRRKNTAHNAVLVAGLTLADLVAAAFLMGFAPGIAGSVLLLFGTAAAFVYNHDLLEKIEGTL